LAAAPALVPPVVVGLVLAALRARTRPGVLLWSAVVPAVLLLPWWVAVGTAPRLLLAEPGGPSAGAGAAGADPLLLPAPAADLVVAPLPAAPHPDPADVVRVAGLVLAVPLLLAALGAVLRRDGRAVAAAGLWTVGLTGLVVAVLAPRLGTALAAGPDAGADRF